MSRKKPHTLRSLGREEAAQANANFDRIYRGSIESTLSWDAETSATLVKPYQVMETGTAIFSANGSNVMTRAFPIRSVMGDIVSVHAQAIHSAVLASVVDLTASSISIQAGPISATALSAVITTAQVRLYWQIIGSAP